MDILNLNPIPAMLASVVGHIAVVYPVLIVLGMLYKRLTAPGFNVAGKHVVVTGGSQGLGMSVAARYAKAGANVTLLARTKSKLEAAQAKIQADLKGNAGAGNVHWVSCDVGNEAKVKAAMAESVTVHGKEVDILVCSAGSARPGYFSEMDMDTHRYQMDINYFGTLNAIHAVTPGMIEKQEGHIVLISSAVCFAPMIGYSAYCPSKYALRGLADCLRNELKRDGIRITIFFPSTLDTPGLENERKTLPAETAEIEGSSADLFSPDMAADKLVAAIADGDYTVTNELLAEIGRMASSGPVPANNFWLELMVAPLTPLIAFGFGGFCDYVATAGKKKKKV